MKNPERSQEEHQRIALKESRIRGIVRAMMAGLKFNRVKAPVSKSRGARPSWLGLPNRPSARTLRRWPSSVRFL